MFSERTNPGDGPKSDMRQLLESMASSLGLTHEAIDRLVLCADFVPMPAVGQVVCTSGERTKVVRLVMRGTLDVVCHPVDCHPLIVRLLGRGSFICPPVMSLEAAVRVDVAVREQGYLALIGYADFQDAIATLGKRAATLASWSFREATDLLYRKIGLLRYDVGERLVLELPVLARQFPARHPTGLVIDVPLAHEDLARIVGATRPTVSRAIPDLVACGFVVQLGPRRFLVRDTLLQMTPRSAIRRIREFRLARPVATTGGHLASAAWVAHGAVSDPHPV